jgi:hypothetical protein
MKQVCTRDPLVGAWRLLSWETGRMTARSAT